ncbi:MAG: DUF4124 domain-containing protein [Granulosicoccus sp.]
MILKISLAILCTSATMAFAQPLYKWVETDGSITFSPHKPPAGTSYETVSKPASSSINSAVAKDALTIDNSQSGTNRKNAPATNQITPAVQAIRSPSTSPGRVNKELGGKATPAALAQADSQSITTTHSASPSLNKQRQCQDLRKRVVSLERRLKSRLTPEDMDNTVVHMARYQRSFDQHCVQ